MNQPDNQSDRPIIRITHAEAMSGHVDDLLKRQMSLRGETGIAFGKGAWYYQNWFVLMIVGAVMALIAWALLERYMDDRIYVQGVIEEVSPYDPLPSYVTVGSTQYEVKLPARGWVEINGEQIWLLEDIVNLSNGQTTRNFDADALRKGQEIGLYAEYYGTSQAGLAMAFFIDTLPPENPPEKASLGLYRQQIRSTIAGLLLFSLVAGMVGLGIGAVDGIICRMPRRALMGAAVGLLVGVFGGFISSKIADLIYSPLSNLAMEETGTSASGLSTFGFVIQTAGRALAWAVAGMAMGLGSGIALRSKRLLLYGFLGGVIGGLLGGLTFDPIDLLILNPDKPSAHISRMLGLTLIGATVGLMIGLVERFVRDAWLRMIEGPLAGKEFLLFRDVMKIGSSPQSAIYLFNDSDVAPHHATLRTVGDRIELQNHSESHPVLVNDRLISQTRLRHGDKISIGRTVFVFESRKGT